MCQLIRPTSRTLNNGIENGKFSLGSNCRPTVFRSISENNKKNRTVVHENSCHDCRSNKKIIRDYCDNTIAVMKQDYPKCQGAPKEL